MNNAVLNQQYSELVQICRKPLFSFLEIEVVKQIKIRAAKLEKTGPKSESVDKEDESTIEQQRKQALDDLI